MLDVPEGFCPLCAHCRSEARKTEILDAAALATLQAAVSSKRCFERPDYGDGRITGVVDWFDGWDQGLHTEKPEVPVKIIDKVSWLEGWHEGRRDATRTWG